MKLVRAIPLSIANLALADHLVGKPTVLRIGLIQDLGKIRNLPGFQALYPSTLPVWSFDDYLFREKVFVRVECIAALSEKSWFYVCEY